jgi:predicted membrane GTPase involved in stress response
MKRPIVESPKITKREVLPNGIIVEHLEPVQIDKPKKSLCPEMAQRKKRARKAMLRDKDITQADFRRPKRGVIAQVVS